MCKRVNGWILAAGIVCASCAAQAAVRIKADNTNNLNLSASWVGSTVPGMYDVALWTNTVTGANAVLMGTNASYMGIWIVNPGGAVGIGGAGILTNGFMGIDLSSATVDLAITNANVTLLDYVSQVWNVTNSRTLTVSPTVLTRNAGTSLGVQGAGAVVSANLTNDATGIIAPWARYGSGTNMKYAAVSGGVIAGYTGTAAATAANVTDTTGTANYEVGAVGTVGAGASFNTLRYTGAAGTIAGDFKANGLLNASPSGTLTLSGNVTVGSGKELVLTSPDTTRTIALSGAIGDSAGGASGVTVTGGGRVNLTGNNTYSGVTVASSGILYVNKTNALGTTAGNTVIHVNGSYATGAQLQIGGGITLAEPLMFVGTGDGTPWNTALYVSGGTNTLTGPITIAMSAGVRITAGGPGTALNINAPITRTGAGSTLILGGGGAGGTLNVNVPINNNGGSVNLHSGPGTINFNVASNNIGDMNVQYKHLLQIGVSDAIGTNGNLNIGNVSASDTTAEQGAFDMLGFNQTVNGLNGNGVTVTAPATTRVISNTVARLSTLTLGNANGSGSFNGAIVGNIALVKTGTGTQMLCGPNLYTGGTTVNGGTLVLSNAVAQGSLVVNGGTLRVPTSLTVSSNFAGNAGTIIDLGLAGTTLTVNQDVNTTVASALTNAGALVKSGAGALTLSGSNTFSGGLTVSGGLLVFSRTAAKPASGSVTVAAGAGLGLGVGGSGFFSSANVDSLWANTLSGVAMDAASAIGIDTSAGDFTYATSQSTRSLIKLGANTLTLSGTNTYAGNTFVNAGVLSIPSTNALPGWDANGRYTVASNAALAVGNAVSNAVIVTMLATTNFAAGASIGFDTSSGDRTYGSAISNTVNGALGLVKIGTNTLTLAGTNAYEGTTVVNGGKMIVKNSTALGSTNGVTGVNRVGGTGPNYTDSTGQLLLDGSAGNLTLGENFILSGAEQYSYTGPLRSSVGNNVLNGWIQISALGARIGVDGGTLTLNGPVGRSAGVVNPMLVLNPNNGMLIVSNRIDIGTGLLNSHSGGTTFICSTSNIWNSLQCQYGNWLRIGANDALNTASKITLGNPEPGNGQFDLYGYNQTLGGLSEYGTAASKLNNIITNSRPSSASTLTVNQASGVVDVFCGRLAGVLSLVKTGSANSVLTLAGTNTLTGLTTVSGGMLVLSNQVALQNSTLTIASGAVGFGGGLTAFTLGGLAGTQNMGLTNASGAAVSLTVGNNNSSTVYSGSLSAGGSLIKIGTGTLTLAGVNTYTGSTTVASGTLALGCANALGSGTQIILAGGTLDPGTYTNSLSALNITSAGGTLALGDGTCALAFANSGGQSWSGTLNITGTWNPTALRFGTDATGLTPAQLSSFRVGGHKVWVQQDAQGYLWKLTGSLLRLY